MGGMKVSNMDFIKLLPAFMQDDEAAVSYTHLTLPTNSRV